MGQRIISYTNIFSIFVLTQTWMCIHKRGLWLAAIYTNTIICFITSYKTCSIYLEHCQRKIQLQMPAYTCRSCAHSLDSFVICYVIITVFIQSIVCFDVAITLLYFSLQSPILGQPKYANISAATNSQMLLCLREKKNRRKCQTGLLRSLSFDSNLTIFFTFIIPTEIIDPLLNGFQQNLLKSMLNLNEPLGTCQLVQIDSTQNDIHLLIFGNKGGFDKGSLRIDEIFMLSI